MALAAALEAEACEILTDVDGVLTADPRVVHDAQRLDSVSYADMFILASSGAAVLMPPAVEYARVKGVSVHVRSSFTQKPGTWLTEDASQRDLVGMAHKAHDEIGVITVVGDASSQAMVKAERALSASGIRAGTVDAGDRFARIDVPAERVDDAVRLVHHALFEMEAKP